MRNARSDRHPGGRFAPVPQPSQCPPAETTAARSSLDHSFAAIICGWEGILAADGRSPALSARRAVEKLSKLGVDIFVISGTGASNVDRLLQARPAGPGELHLSGSSGSDLLRAGPDYPRLVSRRRATRRENVALDQAALYTAQRLAGLGLRVRLAPGGANRRRIELAPESGWSGPLRSGTVRPPATSAMVRDSGPDDLAAVVATARQAVAESGLADARITIAAGHVDIGLTDRSDSMRWALTHLAERGIGPGLLLIAGSQFGPIGRVPGEDTKLLLPGTGRATAISVGAEPAGVPASVLHRPGGPAAFLDVLGALIGRLERGVPDLDDDPSWTLRLPARPDRDRVDETLTTLADGRFGTRGVREEGQDRAAPVLAGGIYTGLNAAERLLAGPDWLKLRWQAGAAVSDERMLDLRTGLLARCRRDENGEFRSLRVVAAARPGVVGLRAEAVGGLSADRLSLPPGADGDCGRREGFEWARVLADPAGGVAAAACQHSSRGGGRTRLERWAAYVADPRRAPTAGQAIERLRATASVPFTALLAEQRATWAARWADGDVLIPDDPELQLCARFALFHLHSSVPGRGEAGVGARGLSGPGYAGHVFWDADVFVLPALAAVRPAAARAMLEYRLRRMPRAKDFARATGRSGCRFPWESGRDGADVTPRFCEVGGQQVPVRTGQAEEHIVADVAWAAWHYSAWTGDEAFLAGAGSPLLIETARYWISRARLDHDGRAHIYGVSGPDEYHTPVDDNAFTNVLARWNLRRAADLAHRVPGLIEADEIRTWRSVADSLVDGYDADTGVYEQFAGYNRLQQLLPASLGRVPLAADSVLGAGRIAETQIIKQADVLMAYHLLPDEMPAGTLKANLDFYGPRTAHGSSLSPAIHAALLARAGLPDEALNWLRLAARLDLDDLTGTTATGLHLATFGGLWQAIALGFAGLRGDHGVLRIDPHLPSAWSMLTLRLRFRGRAVTVTASHDWVSVACSAPISVALADGPAVLSAQVTWPHDGGRSALPAAISR
jgi:trehalose/maltose hydrolase-like predicted phosphorylase